MRPIFARLLETGIGVSLFVDPDPVQLDAVVRLGAPIVELHAGTYAHKFAVSHSVELAWLAWAVSPATAIGLECHAGLVAAIPSIRELNIGHFVVGEAIFIGLADTTRTMKPAIELGAWGAKS